MTIDPISVEEIDDLRVLSILTFHQSFSQFNKKENLYYRDASYIGKLDNGTKIFWGRGNGWVFAGLANILAELEPQSKEYKYFVKIYFVKRSEYCVPSIRISTDGRLAHTHRIRRQHEFTANAFCN